MYALRKLVPIGVAALLALTACQGKQVETVDVDASGAVTVTDVGTATLTAPVKNTVFAKPDVKTLLAQAKAWTHGYVGPGVGKPVVTLVKVGSAQYVLTVSQRFADAAVLARHYAAFDSASLDIDEKTDTTTGISTETLVVDKPTSDGPKPPAVALVHAGHDWSLTFTLSPKSFAELAAQAKQLNGIIAQSGAPAGILILAEQVHLPGTVSSTNGTREPHGLVSWNLLKLRSRVLTVSSKE